MPARPRLLPLLLLLGCGDSEPFTNPDTGTDKPFDPGPPVRITANRGGDFEPAWLADGSGTLYSVSDPGREDRDVPGHDPGREQPAVGALVRRAGGVRAE